MPLFIFLLIALGLPMAILLERNGAVIETLPAVMSTVGISLLIFAVIMILKRRSIKLARIIGIVGLLAALWVRFLLGFLYDFSGRGFSGEFFAHFSFESIEIALHEYQKEGWVMLGLFSALLFYTYRKIKHLNILPLSINFGLFATGVLVLYFSAAGSPEIQLAQAYNRFTLIDRAQISASNTQAQLESSQLLAPIRGQIPVPIEKNQLRASLPKKPLNLILVYLESFNNMLTENENHPNLTPRIDALKARYLALSNIHSSAYVTIEGIANSQCGTLFNMEYKNNSLTTRKGRLPALPCLADILQKAGYKQVYYGGAELDFAGKGDFLKEHGYDELYGNEIWDDKGYERVGVWGLSDSHLFDMAYERIQTLSQQDTPFNLTLLTLGTHIPGYHYDECPIYTDDKNKAFLNAIHCTDFLLGQFVDKLEAAGTLNDSLLFVQGDHGGFPTPHMKKLFGDDITDTRLLTLLAIPEDSKKRLGQIPRDKQGSSVDTVASILDILQIKHNTNFVFSNSYFKDTEKPSYFLTRRNDFYQGKRIANEEKHCDRSNQVNEPINLPLESCAKSTVMQSISKLNLSYAEPEQSDNKICELGVEISRDNKQRIKLVWGNQNLSDQFYWHGLKKPDDLVDGIYAVLLDNNSNVISSQFFSATRTQEIWWLHDLLNTPLPDQPILLINNANTKALRPAIRKIWPSVLLEHELVYGALNNRRIKPIIKLKSIDAQVSFSLPNCDIKF